MWQVLKLAMILNGAPDADEPTRLPVSLSGVLAVDERTAVVWGYLQGQGCPAESLLLRTTDWGAHWETSFPGEPSYVVGPVLAVGTTLWAVSSFSCEDAGEAVLYRSTDAGAHWSKLSTLAPGDHGGSMGTTVSSLKFTSARDGVLETVTSNPDGADKRTRSETHDGGAHWTVKSIGAAKDPDRPLESMESRLASGTRWTLRARSSGGYDVTVFPARGTSSVSKLPATVPAAGTRPWRVAR